MNITHLKTNHIVNPLGFAIEKPTFSWMVEDTYDTVQTAAQIWVSLDSNFKQVIFDSGEVEGNVDIGLRRAAITHVAEAHLAFVAGDLHRHRDADRVRYLRRHA